MELLSDKEEIQELKSTVYEFKRLTEEARQQYKLSHKMKLDYSKMIRSLTNSDEKRWIYFIIHLIIKI